MTAIGSKVSDTVVERLHSKMVQNTKGNGTLEKPLVRANLSMFRERSMKVNGSTTVLMVLELSTTETEQFTKESGIEICKMVKVKRFGLMEVTSRGLTLLVKRTDMENTIGQEKTEVDIPATGKQTKWQVSEYTNGPTAEVLRASGKTTK